MDILLGVGWLFFSKQFQLYQLIDQSEQIGLNRFLRRMEVGGAAGDGGLKIRVEQALDHVSCRGVVSRGRS